MDKRSVLELIEEQLVKGEINLPVSEKTAVNLSNLLRKKDLDAVELTALIEKDPSLAVKFLNLSNSPLYAGLAKIKSVEQAVIRLGLKATRNFLLTITFHDIFRGRKKYLRDQFAMNWRHSLACGICAKKIAENSNMMLVAEDSYLLGLLHDIGVVAILDTLVTLLKREDDSTELGEELIIEIIYTFHPLVGAKILRMFDFDEMFCKIVELHHEQESYEDKDSPLFNILQVADHLLKKISLSLVPDTDISISVLPYTTKLGLDPFFISVMEVDIEDLLAGIDEIF